MNEKINEAAARIRIELCYGGSAHDFYAHIADWLEDEAALPTPSHHAHLVARAFLNGRHGRATSGERYLDTLESMTADPVLLRRIKEVRAERQAPEIGLEPHPVHGGNPRPWFIAGWAILCAFIVIGLGLVLGWWR